MKEGDTVVTERGLAKLIEVYDRIGFVCVLLAPGVYEFPRLEDVRAISPLELLAEAAE